MNKKWLTIGLFLLSIIVAISGFFIKQQYLQSIIANISITFFGGALGVLIVNIYIEKSEKKKALKSLLRMIAPTVARASDTMLAEVHRHFGTQEFSEIQIKYKKSGGDPKVLTPTERDKIYDMIHNNKSIFEDSAKIISEELKELAVIMGWSFNPAVLRELFDCRTAIRAFMTLSFTGTPQDKLDTCEQYLDFHIKAHSVVSMLHEQAK